MIALSGTLLGSLPGVWVNPRSPPGVGLFKVRRDGYGRKQMRGTNSHPSVSPGHGAAVITCLCLACHCPTCLCPTCLCSTCLCLTCSLIELPSRPGPAFRSHEGLVGVLLYRYCLVLSVSGRPVVRMLGGRSDTAVESKTSRCPHNGKKSWAHDEGMISDSVMKRKESDSLHCTPNISAPRRPHALIQSPTHHQPILDLAPPRIPGIQTALYAHQAKNSDTDVRNAF